MKKILFTTAIGCLAASATLAAGPKVMLGGNLDFQYGMVSQKSDFKLDDKPSSKDSHSLVESEMFVDVNGKVGNGLTYGAHISLNGDISNSLDYDTDNGVREAYGYIESTFGHLQFGATGDAAEHMKVDASSIAVANGGIDGNFWKYLNFNPDDETLLSSPSSSSSQRNPFYMKPGLQQAKGAPGAYNTEFSNYVEDQATANKISYYSPKVSGTQLGFTFTPDTEEKGGAGGFSSKVKSTEVLSSTDSASLANTPLTAHSPMENVFDISIGYEKEYRNVGMKFSAAYEGGSAKYKTGSTSIIDDTTLASQTIDSKFTDLAGYNVGAMVDYMGMQFAGSFGQITDTGATKLADESVMYYTLGAKYETGPFRASVTYLGSTTSAKSGYTADSSSAGDLLTGDYATEKKYDYDFSNIALGLDYKLAPGFTPYVEADFFSADSKDEAVTKNDGSVFLIGARVNF